MITNQMRDGSTPESLMESFKGVTLVKMAAVTVVFHLVMIASTSVSYLRRSVFGDTNKLTREQKLDRAVEETTSAMRKIAAENGLNPQDISERFAPRGAKVVADAPTGKEAGAAAPVEGKAPEPAASTVDPAAPQPAAGTPATAEPTPEKPKSTIEKQLEVKVPGPTMPEVGAQDDVF